MTPRLNARPRHSFPGGCDAGLHATRPAQLDLTCFDFIPERDVVVAGVRFGHVVVEPAQVAPGSDPLTAHLLKREVKVGAVFHEQALRLMEPGGFEPPTSCLQNPAGVLWQDR